MMIVTIMSMYWLDAALSIVLHSYALIVNIDSHRETDQHNNEAPEDVGMSSNYEDTEFTEDIEDLT